MIYRFGRFVLDPAAFELRWEGDIVHLEPRVLELLIYLVENRSRVCGKEDLFEHVWDGQLVSESSLTRTMSRLRKSLEADRTHHWIRTVHGKGYRFSGPVQEQEGMEQSLLATEQPSTPEADSSKPPCVAVLPFASLTEQSGDYFCDGLTEEITSALARIPGLRVVGRTSSVAASGLGLPLEEIAARLGASHVVEGSVRRVDRRARVVARLVGGSGEALWSERYDEQVVDTLAIQDEIAGRIAETLRLTVVESPSSTGPSADPRASELYFHGLQYRQKQTASDLEAAREALEAAVRIDANFARAHAALANTCVTLYLNGYPNGREALVRAQQAVEHALELDGDLEDAHVARGLIESWAQWRWEAAEASYRRALALNPSHMSAMSNLANSVLVPTGRTGEAVELQRRAYELNPLSHTLQMWHAAAFYWDRQLGEAIAAFRQLMSVAPGFPLARNLFSSVLSTADEPEQAARERWRLFRETGRIEEARELWQAFTASGELGVLDWSIERALQGRQEEHNRAFNLALLHARAERPQEAIEWLRVAVDRRDPFAIFAGVHPWLDSLRDSPEFHRVVEMMGLTVAARS